MANAKVALILAAGNGSRLAACSGELPKPLVPVDGRPLIEHVMSGAYEAGIERFVIVVGYRGQMIQDWYRNQRRCKVDVSWVHNPEYHKNNGVSVLLARESIQEPFLLLMSDHLFESTTARSLLRQPIGQDEVILAVDRKVASVFDLEDATKVRLWGNCIVDIGKNLKSYDALDTGMFLCRPVLFRWLECAIVNGNCSLSDGLRVMGQRRKFRAFDIGDAYWQDVDTPSALKYACDSVHLRSRAIRSVARPAYV